jgi:uncharacterized heparinase superfamily protein
VKWRALDARLTRFKNTMRPFLDGNTFTFNNEARAAPGWNEPGARKLWLYNLHYMSWLFDLESPEAREAWIGRWIRENPRTSGGAGWDPYPVSLRLFNTLKHYTVSGRAPDALVRGSLAEQSGWLLMNLEFHLDGNHLLENLFALAYAGIFWDGSVPRVAKARRRVQRLLEEAMREQFLPDGGHYELSPMYHAILLERLLDLLNVWPETEDPFPGLRDTLERRARAGLDWLDVMSVKGSFALFNDSAYDTAPNAGNLMEYGSRLLGWASLGPMPLRALPASGYYRAEAGPFTLVFDAGDLGPDHQMGHAQGDMVSFCLWVNGLPILVHPGNYEYVGGEMRDYCRSTAAHNTFAPQGAEQGEWWGSHRVGRRGSILEAFSEYDFATGLVILRGTHDGYAMLPGHPLHTRAITMSGEKISILDALSAGLRVTCLAWHHFHPDCEVRLDGDGTVSVRLPGGVLRLASDRPLRLETSWHCPEFGRRLPSVTAVAEAPGPESRVTLTWNPSAS